MDDSIASADNFIWTADSYKGKFSELNTGWWWREVEQRSQARSRGFFIMPIIFYIDESHPDFRQGADLKPIVVSCGNYIGAVNRTRAGKRCIGYFQTLRVSAR